jgi:photosystem II stability/assembly factor-like uncharacterized protein
MTVRFSRGLIPLFLSLVSYSSVLAQTGSWSKQPTGSLAWLHSVFFLDQNRGWAVGSKGAMLTTVDGGKTWQRRTDIPGDVIRDIYFSDAQNGWLVVERNIYELEGKDEPRTYLMQTADGGSTWKRIDIKGVAVDVLLVRAVFSPGGHGWAFGEEGTIYRTVDAGINWTRLSSPTRRLLLGGAFIDDQVGWLVGAGATIIQTADGGETWSRASFPQASETPVRFSATSFVNNRLGWAVGSGGTVYRTINGGRSWQQQNSGVAVDLLDVKFLDAVEGWAVGNEGTIIYTNDGGLHWTTERSGTVHPLERVFFADRTHGWAVGFGGTVVAYGRAEAPPIRR